MDYNLKSIKKQFKLKGVFYTPPELAKMIKSYVNIDTDEVYDPTCGDGGLLKIFSDNVKKYGQEIDNIQLDVAKDNLINFTGYCGDTLKEPAFLDRKFKCIVANPPFSISWKPNEADIRFKDAPTIPSKGKADFAFILHILYMLKNDGIAVTLNFPGIAYRGNREKTIRKWIIEQNWIERVVNIPSDTFVDTKISTLLIVYNKNKKTKDIIFEDKELNKTKTVKFEEVKENDFCLSVSNYIQKEKVKENINPVELNGKARNDFITNLEKELNFDLMVCNIEKYDKFEYVNRIIKKCNQFKSKIKE